MGFFADAVAESSSSAASDAASGSCGGGSYMWVFMGICFYFMMAAQKSPIFSIILIVVFIAPLAKTLDYDKWKLDHPNAMPGTCNGMAGFVYTGECCKASICIDSNQGTMLSLWFAFWIAMFVGCVANLIFSYIGHIIEDTINTVFMCYAIDQDNGAVRPGALCVQLQKMPQMASPIAIAIPMTKEAAMEMADKTVANPVVMEQGSA
jgi:hypothetical protein